jgi:hypothetical protein
MTFVTKPAKDIKTIRQGDRDFMLNDGMITYPRAMMHVTPECPQEVRSTIMWAVNNGYLKCVAHAYGKELTMDALR